MEMNSLDLAKESNDINILRELARSVNSSVRRAVARNINTPSKILDKLAFDPVMNVCYMAISNQNCSIIRNFSDTSNPCISCQRDERTVKCNNCVDLKAYYDK